MEENKKVYKKNSIWAPNKLVPILFYILFFFVVSAVIIYLIAYIYSNINNVDYNTLKSSYTMKADTFKSLPKDILKANAITQGISNLLVYSLCLIPVIFFTRDEFVKDIIKIKENKKFYLWFIPVAVVAFVGICYLVDLLFKNITPSSSENQQQIENILTNGGLAPMLITTIFLAPLLEELIFRKCIFSLCGKNRIVLAYIVSIILFVLPHMLSTSTDIGTWVLQCIPYVVAASLLATIYHLSGFNFYVGLFAHISNNILAIILVFI